MKTFLKIFLPLVVLAVGGGGAALMIKSRKPVVPKPVEILPPLVKLDPIVKQNHRFRVLAQGTVVPRTEITLVPEVSGRVVSIAPSLTAGGFFEKGDVLLSINPRDFELAVTRARSQLAEAQVRITREEAEAEVARKEWESLGKGKANPLLLREPQLAEARAMMSSVQAALEQAQYDLERCRLKAPFAGRVREKNVDIGQYVTKGAAVARLYAVDYAEVRLPLPVDELAFLDLPLNYRGEETQQPQPTVTLRASFAGETHEWKGRIVRTEGEVDPRTRMLTAVARVENPYGRGEKAGRPPLAVGLFVHAESLGREARDVYVVSRTALRGDQLIAVDKENRLRFRKINEIRRDTREVVFQSGIEPGDRACVSPLDAPVGGMGVRTNGEGKAQPTVTAGEKEAP